MEAVRGMDQEFELAPPNTYILQFLNVESKLFNSNFKPGTKDKGFLWRFITDQACDTQGRPYSLVKLTQCGYTPNNNLGKLITLLLGGRVLSIEEWLTIAPIFDKKLTGKKFKCMVGQETNKAGKILNQIYSFDRGNSPLPIDQWLAEARSMAPASQFAPPPQQQPVYAHPPGGAGYVQQTQPRAHIPQQGRPIDDYDDPFANEGQTGHVHTPDDELDDPFADN